MSGRPPRLAVLHSRFTPPGAPLHMISVIERNLRASGVDVVHLYSPDRFVPADALFVHVDLSVVPDSVAKLAAKYPLQINAGARDIRKSSFADGLLERWNTYEAPVIVKSDLNYGGVPEFRARGITGRAVLKAQRLLSGRPGPKVLNKSDYRVYPTLSAVPRELFADGTVVQKFFPEKDGDRNILREYIFLGNLHYENIERSTHAIITEDEHVSCEPFSPHPRLLNLRKRMKLDYGKIDYVMLDGEPFIFDVNKTMGLGQYGNTPLYAQDIRGMIKSFACQLHQLLLQPPDAAKAAIGIESIVTPSTMPLAQPRAGAPEYTIARRA